MKDIETLSWFMKWVEDLGGDGYIFRGVSSEKYLIEASTYRRLKDDNGEFRNAGDDSPEKLLQINEEMIQEAHHQGHLREKSSLEVLADLQHRGAATCLIDFTENPLVALWMACRQGSDKQASGKVYAVNVKDRNKFQIVDYEKLKLPIRDFFKQDQNSGYSLYQWKPNYQESRMLAQQSIFLFGGGKIEPAAEYTILSDHKRKLRIALDKSLGISEATLFPDLNGFASQRAHNKAYDELDNDNQNESLAIVYLNLARQAVQDGRTDEAIRYYTFGMDYPSSNALLSVFYSERAVIFFNTGDFPTAINDFSEAIRLNPTEYSFHWRGRAKYHLNLYWEAISDYDQAIILNPGSAYNYYWRGLSKYHLNLYWEAISDFDQAIILNPGDAYTFHWRGLSKYNVRQYQAAISDLDRAIVLNPDNAYTYHWRGMAKYDLGRYWEAISDFDQAINRHPTDEHFYYWRAMTKKRLQMFDESGDDFQIALIYSEGRQNQELINAIHRERLP